MIIAISWILKERWKFISRRTRLFASSFWATILYFIRMKRSSSFILHWSGVDKEIFYSLIEEYKSEYFKMNLCFIVRRLLRNLVQERLRKITVCYSRIKVDDISKILGTYIDYLIHKTIKEGYVQGFVQDGIFYGGNGVFENRHCDIKSLYHWAMKSILRQRQNKV